MTKLPDREIAKEVGLVIDSLGTVDDAEEALALVRAMGTRLVDYFAGKAKRSVLIWHLKRFRNHALFIAGQVAGESE